MCDWPFLTKEAACGALREAGLELTPAELRIEAREDRWAVSLPGEQMAWFPANEGGRRRLSIERRVLRLLADRCTFSAPRILFESASGCDLRAVVSGLCDPWGLYERTRTDTALARRIGRAIGAMLIEQHARIGSNEVVGWLLERVAWPEPGDRVRARLRRVVDDRRLVSRLDRVLRAYEQVAVQADDRVLVHGDLGLHNIAVDAVTAEVRGIFDYDGAAWADRHHDFRYLIFHSTHQEALDAALEIYEPAVDRRLDRDRIRLYNAACAIGFLANRCGVPAHEKSCGRTLAEDLSWVHDALARLPID
ncbi:MAG TPA: aminoglycoside phosphotransferase family protein [Xanthobacteraceae bacterium]|nr:aminoglycoside phosphotransferase family protein [Xanthobacteraceae bacterium]